MLTRSRKPLRRTAPMKRTAIKPRRGPRKVPYGGPVAPEYGGTMQAFWEMIDNRDGGVCYVCRGAKRCGKLELMHLHEKVKMGGRRTSTVNVPWNVVIGGSACHQQQEGSRALTRQLLGRMYRDYGYPELIDYKDEPPNTFHQAIEENPPCKMTHSPTISAKGSNGQ